MKHYVVGFLFDHRLVADRPYVCLIKKTHPAWQKGKLNGVGGHIEEGESANDAMRREFREEAGLDISKWKHFATLELSGEFICNFFCSDMPNDADAPEPISVTDEKITWEEVYDLPENVISNLRWLIPLALDSSVDRPVKIFMKQRLSR